MTDDFFYLRQLEIGPMQNFIYLVGDRRSRECLVVDPAWDIDPVLEMARGDQMKVLGGLLTHTHYDHCNAAEALSAKTRGIIYVHEKEASFLKGIKSGVREVDSGSEIPIGGFKITVIHTPGHTPGSQCFLVEGNLFSGDTLFVDACGRCDLPGSDARQMYKSLQKLAQLKDETVVLAGHHYGDVPTSTIGREKRHNPYYQSASLEDFLAARMGY